MKTRFLIIIGMLLSIGFTGIAFAMHDPDQPLDHSIILPPDMKEKTFDEFMEWCMPYYGEKCIELEKKRTPIILSPLKQFKSGIPLDEIQCKESMTLMSPNEKRPACVTMSTASKLSDRGWFWMLDVIEWNSNSKHLETDNDNFPHVGEFIENEN